MLVLLLIFTSVTLLTWYARKNFNKMYRMAEKLGGPKGYPFIGHVHLFLGKEFLDAMMEADSKYFGIARYWFGHKLIISINNPALYGELLSNKTALDKGEFYHFMKPLFGDGLIASDFHIWQVNRKVVAPTLNNLKVKSSLQVFIDGSERMAQSWERKVGEKFEPYSDVSRATFGFTLRTALGTVIADDWPESQVDELIALVNSISAGVAYRFLRPWLYPDFIFNLSPTGREVSRKTAAFRRVLEGMINSKSAGAPNEDNSNSGFINHVLSASKINNKFTYSSVLDELSTYMTAGFETTSTAITFNLVMLGCHPQFQEKVADEQRALLGDNQILDWDSICKMDYLECFIKETMRLFPVITLIGRQLASDINIGDYVLPKGAFTMIPIFAVHRKAEIWENPTEFNPDRFSSMEVKKRNSFAFLPFGGGPRICMGQRYAMIALKTIIAAIVRRFIIQTDYTMEEINLSKAVTLNTNGLNISLVRRI